MILIKICSTDGVKPWKSVEEMLYIDTIQGIRGVRTRAKLPPGILVSIYPNDREMKKTDYERLATDDPRIHKCVNYTLERSVPKRPDHEVAGKYVYFPSADTPAPPYGHLFNHCHWHPNLKVTFIKCRSLQNLKYKNVLVKIFH